jgi:hypothetical protein
MRELDVEQLEALSKEFISYYYLVNLNGIRLETSGPSDQEFGGGTYLASGKLQSVDPPKLSPAVDREAYKIVYNDPDFELRSYFEAGISGVLIDVYFVLVDVLNPEVRLGDPILAYSGYVDAPTYSIDPDGNVTATIEGTSPMGSLAVTNTVITAKDSIKQINPDDTCFDQIYEGSKALTLLWGKIDQ